jgi:hypothetical protein
MVEEEANTRDETKDAVAVWFPHNAPSFCGTPAGAE